MKIWKPFLTACISVFIIATPSAITNGCASDDMDYLEVQYPSIVSPEVFDVPTLQPLFYSYHTYYGDWIDYADDAVPVKTEEELGKEINLKEWQQFFKQKPSLADIDSVVYKADENLLAEIEKYVTRKKNNLPEKWRKNSLVKYFRKQKKSQEALLYIQFVRQCGPYVLGNSDDWSQWSGSDEDEEDAAEEGEVSAEALIKEGIKRYLTSGSEFMKLRYAYQVVRLAHYTQEPDKAVILYDQLVAPLEENSQLKYWAMSHKAGALLRLEQTEEALYTWAVVFANCPSRRIDAYDGFYRFGGGVCEACLGHAKTDKEKTAFWFLQAISLYPVGLQSMQQIYALAPASEELDVLLAREINKLEDYKLSESRGGSPYYGSTLSKPETDTYLNDVTTFVKAAAAAGKTRKPYLWQFAAGYLAFLQDKPEEAKSYFDLVKKSRSADQLLLDNLHLIEMMQRTKNLQKMDATTEQQVLQDLLWLDGKTNEVLRKDYARSFIYSTMVKLYDHQNDGVKYQLVTAGNYLIYQRKYDVMENLIALLNKPDHSPFEKYHLKNFEYKTDNLKEMQGTNLLSNFAFAEAAAKFREIKNDSILNQLPADPFTSRLNDCHDCDFEMPQEKTYTKLTLAEEMNRLHQALKKNPANAAEIHFRLANAYYNLTYFGNSRRVLQSGHSISYNFGYQILPKNFEITEFNYNSFWDCRKAQDHYELARRAASRNPEFAAKAAFMAAKCEQNRYYTSNDFRDDQHLNPVPARYRNYFRLLKQRYSNTRYYQEILNECGYFETFAAKQ